MDLVGSLQYQTRNQCSRNVQLRTPGSMGTSPSREERPASQSSTTPLHVASSDPEKRHSAYTTGADDSDEISYPGLPRRVTHISQLIDPTELQEGWMVRSPSGNLLGPSEFLQHPERPLSLRERQERVKAAMSAPSSPLTDRTSAMMSPKITQMSSSSGTESCGAVTERKKRRRWWLCCFC